MSFCVLSMAAFVQQSCSSRVAIETIWLSKSKIFTIWLFKKKFADLCSGP